MNYFEIFDIEEKFEIDKNLLQYRYIELQRKHHPDISEADKLKQMQFVTDLNNGYRILKDDYSRAAYYLKLRNIDILSEKQNNIKISSEMLINILEKREELEETRSEDQLLKMKSNELAQREENLRLISECLEKNEIESAAICTMLLKYQDNLISAINQKIEQCL